MKTFELLLGANRNTEFHKLIEENNIRYKAITKVTIITENTMSSVLKFEIEE